MNTNIDLIKILKDCPKETELYSPMYGKVYFSSIYYLDEGSVIYCHKTKLDEGCTRPIDSQSTDIVAFYSNGTTGNPDFNVTPECMLFPSEFQRDWTNFSASWYKKRNKKFNPETLQPFDKVLVRDISSQIWRCDFLSHIKYGNINYPYVVISAAYKFCIPYNDDTKHLVGTTSEAPEFYRYWKD